MENGKQERSEDRDPQRTKTFLDDLRQQQSTRITNNQLWSLFHKNFPYRSGSTEGRQWLSEILLEAEQQGIIRLPAFNGKSWDRGLFPPIPLSVRKQETSFYKRNTSWRSFPWHPQLSWVANLETVSPEQEVFLSNVQEALVQGILEKPAPLKYRSLQLTGNEKRLGEIMHTSLFQPGRLSLELLGCVPEFPPLVVERVGENDVGLIFENVGAFKTAYNVLKQLPQAPYGWLGLGAGAAFERSILHFKFFAHHIERLEYVGDIDRPGLRIARSASQRAETEHLPPIVPAKELHKAMILSVRRFGYSSGIDYKATEKKHDPKDELLVSWLPYDVRNEILTIIRSGKRIPEEVLGPDELREVWENFVNEI